MIIIIMIRDIFSKILVYHMDTLKKSYLLSI